MEDTPADPTELDDFVCATCSPRVPLSMLLRSLSPFFFYAIFLS